MNPFARSHKTVRSLILDYALGAAIIAMLPIPSIRLIKLVVLAILNIKLVRDIGRLWGFPGEIGVLAKVGSLFGILSSFLLGFFVWAVGVVIAGRFPILMPLASGVALFSYFWSMGQATNHYYLSSLHIFESDAEPHPDAEEPDAKEN